LPNGIIEIGSRNPPPRDARLLAEANPDRERLRVLAQALAGAALSGKTEEDAEKLIGTTAPEKAALGKLLANWRSVVENVIESREERAERRRGQKRLFE
jgi:putative DNA methylase